MYTKNLKRLDKKSDKNQKKEIRKRAFPKKEIRKSINRISEDIWSLKPMLRKIFSHSILSLAFFNESGTPGGIPQNTL
jgi:hypothetical protein